jgi:hypothetical protein
MAQLYADENFPLPVVEELRRFGHDVLTMYEDGKAERSIPDDEVLALASASHRAVLTINRKHFIRLHRQKPEHADIVVCTFDPDFIGQAERIRAAVESTGELSGQLIRVNRPG